MNTADGASSDLTVIRGLVDCDAFSGEPVPGGKPSDSLPFLLSVIVRTSPGRSVTLAQALESLTRQVSNRFELIVVSDGMDNDQVAEVSTLVDGFRDKLPGEVRLLTTEGEKTGRSAALNTALSVVGGTHFAVLDDDLAEPSWVSTFEEVAKSEPERVIRTLCYRQEWVKTGEAPRQDVSAVGPLSDDYPMSFLLLTTWWKTGPPL